MLYVVCARSVWIKILDDETFLNLTGFSLLYYSMVFQEIEHICMEMHFWSSMDSKCTSEVLVANEALCIKSKI